MTVYLMLSAGRGPRECAWAVTELTAEQALTTTRWHVHDELVRGDPVRTERTDGRGSPGE